MRGSKETYHGDNNALHDEEKRWKTTPLGVKILLIYISVLALFYLIFGLTIPTNVFFGYLFTGASARIVNLVVLVFLLSLIFGLMLKKHWAGKLAMFWFGLEIINLITSLALGKAILQDGALVDLIMIFVIGINGFILWYLFEKREYFTDLRHHHTSGVDKIFVLGIFSMMFFAIAATTTYGINVYKDTIVMTDKVISEFGQKGGASLEEAEFICSTKIGKEKDVCYMVVASAYNNAPKTICDKIDYKFYKLTCIQAVIL